MVRKLSFRNRTIPHLGLPSYPYPVASPRCQQVDPLSPFLFILVADSLSQIITNAESKNLFKGFQGDGESECFPLTVCRWRADFYGWRSQFGRILKSLIWCFELVSELKVNWSKSHIFGIALSNSESIQVKLVGVSSPRMAFTISGIIIRRIPKERRFLESGVG